MTSRSYDKQILRFARVPRARSGWRRASHFFVI